MHLNKELIGLAPKLRAYAWMMARGAADADDLVAEALQRAWKGRSSLAADANLQAWLFRIVRTVCLASLAGGFRRSASAVPAERTRPGAGALAAWRARFADLLEVLDELPDTEAEALILVAGAGLSYAEAADVCYCSLSAIKQRVARARALMVELVRDEPAPYAPGAACSAVRIAG